jgi:hypothetical protein
MCVFLGLDQIGSHRMVTLLQAKKLKEKRFVQVATGPWFFLVLHPSSSRFMQCRIPTNNDN